VAKENLWDRTRPDGFEGASGLLVALGRFVRQFANAADGVDLPAFGGRRSGGVCAESRHTAGYWNQQYCGTTDNSQCGAENHFKQGHPLLPDLFVLDEGAWKLHIPEDAELREIWVGMRRQGDRLDYNQQKQLLDKLHEKG
jgi:hypothetical protein